VFAKTSLKYLRNNRKIIKFSNIVPDELNDSSLYFELLTLAKNLLEEKVSETGL
jgi:hypothetical protein